MIAIDTNVLVRFIVSDDPDQSAAARLFMARNQVFIGSTVLLETEWVLRSAYNYTLPDIVTFLRAVIGLPSVAVESKLTFALALDWMQQGMAFADALHLASAQHCEAFATFDRRLTKLGRRLSAIPVHSP